MIASGAIGTALSMIECSQFGICLSVVIAALCTYLLENLIFFMLGSIIPTVTIGSCGICRIRMCALCARLIDFNHSFSGICHIEQRKQHQDRASERNHPFHVLTSYFLCTLNGCLRNNAPLESPPFLFYHQAKFSLCSYNTLGGVFQITNVASYR